MKGVSGFAWPKGMRLAIALVSAAAVLSVVAGPAMARRAKHKPVTGLVGTMVYSGSISYAGDDTDERVLANCGDADNVAPEAEHRTLGLKFTTTYKHVVLSINNGRKHNGIQELAGTTKLGATSYTDRGTNYRAGGPDVDPSDCLSAQTKVTWNCSGRLARAVGGVLTLFSDITRFKFDIDPIADIGASPGVCATAWYPREDPLSYGDPAYTNAGDFTGYWDDQGGFTEFGLLAGLHAQQALNLGTAKAWAALAHKRVMTKVLTQGQLPAGFTDCTLLDDVSILKDTCAQTQDGQAKLTFVVTKVLHN
jgi:hypothetical protein